MNVKKYLPVIVLMLTGLIYTIHRDILIEKEGTVDLRNRVVGARLQKDGISPYFFKWKATDSLRYYDPSGFSYERFSNITATPFFHTLFYPIADLPQRQISYIWLVCEYVILFVITLLACLLARNNLQRWLVIATSLLFLLTEAWQINIGCGQLYIVIPFIAMLFYYCLHKPDNLFSAFLAGIFAVSLILVRPNTVVFFIPFLFLLKNYSRRFILVSSIAGGLLTGYYFLQKENRLFWSDYRAAVSEAINFHQNADLVTPPPKPTPVNINEWEGWDMEQTRRDSLEHKFEYHSEHGNVFVLYAHIFHRKIPLRILNLLSIASVLLIVLLFFFSNKKYGSLTLPNVAIIGFCLYMITDFFSPVWRHQYNTVPWIFPLLIAAAYYKASNKWVYVLLLTGLILNITNTDWIKMEHTIGEYLLMVSFIFLSLTRNLQPGK